MKIQEKKYEYGTKENQSFLKENRDLLLKFGHKFPSPKGSSYYLGDDGSPCLNKSRETWITSRMAHVYSIGSFLGHEDSFYLAGRAIYGLINELEDKKYGGWYGGLSATGEVLPFKQCYAHAFVILAASSGVLAKIEGAEELLDRALSIHDKYFWDEDFGLAYDTWDTEFTKLDDYRGINANMHTVEAFLAVADVTKREVYRERARRIINHVIVWAKENSWRIPEHFTKTWETDLFFNQEHLDDPFKPFGATPGHGIEWARLICQWALSTYSNDRKKAEPYLKAAEELYKRAVADGWNRDGGEGFIYTNDWEGNPVVHDRMHWVLAEAINTSSIFIRLTGEEIYKQDYAKFMAYLDNYVIDKFCGSWFHQMDKNQKVLTSVWPGKSDIYHAFQAMLIPYQSMDTSIAVAVKGKQEIVSGKIG